MRKPLIVPAGSERISVSQGDCNKDYRLFVTKLQNLPNLSLADELRHDFGGGKESVDAATVEGCTGFEVAEGGTADVGGHAGVVAEGEGVGGDFAVEGAAGDLDVSAEGFFGVAGVHDAADGHAIAIDNSRQL